MRLPSLTLAGLAFLELNAQHAGPEAKGVPGVIGRKLHQGDRMPRHGVKTHTRRIVALDHRRPNLAVRVRRHIRAADPLSCARRTLRELESGPRRPSGRSASPSDLLSTRAPRLRCAGARGSRRSTPEPLLGHARPAPRRQRCSGGTRWPYPVAAFLGTEQQHPAGRAPRPVHLPVMPQTTACESAHRLCECATRGRCARIRCKGHRCTRLSGVTARWAPGARRESAWQRRRR
jgi:hypothetical protein